MIFRTSPLFFGRVGVILSMLEYGLRDAEEALRIAAENLKEFHVDAAVSFVQLADGKLGFAVGDEANEQVRELVGRINELILEAPDDLDDAVADVIWTYYRPLQRQREANGASLWIAIEAMPNPGATRSAEERCVAIKQALKGIGMHAELAGECDSSGGFVWLSVRQSNPDHPWSDAECVLADTILTVSDRSYAVSSDDARLLIEHAIYEAIKDK